MTKYAVDDEPALQLKRPNDAILKRRAYARKYYAKQKKKKVSALANMKAVEPRKKPKMKGKLRKVRLMKAHRRTMPKHLNFKKELIDLAKLYDINIMKAKKLRTEHAILRKMIGQ